MLLFSLKIAAAHSRDFSRVRLHDGEDTGKETTIPVGTVVVPIRCDDNSYIDVEADDGTIYRIYFSSLEYPGYINNKEVTEYFSGIVYVG